MKKNNLINDKGKIVKKKEYEDELILYGSSKEVFIGDADMTKGGYVKNDIVKRSYKYTDKSGKQQTRYRYVIKKLSDAARKRKSKK